MIYTKTEIGEKLAEILMLKEDKGDFKNGKTGYNPKRYKTTWGNKTALGLYETIKRIIEIDIKKIIN